jgi:hypothetical protein
MTDPRSRPDRTPSGADPADAARSAADPAAVAAPRSWQGIYTCTACGIEEEGPAARAPAMADLAMTAKGWSLGAPALGPLSSDLCPICALSFGYGS